MHFWFGNMFGNHWDVKFPDEEFFVVGAGHEFVLFDEGYCVDCSKMLAVLHLFFACVDVELHDFSIA